MNREHRQPYAINPTTPDTILARNNLAGFTQSESQAVNDAIMRTRRRSRGGSRW